MDKKRTYLKPSMLVVKLNQQTSLLTGSNKFTGKRNNPYGSPIGY